MRPVWVLAPRHDCNIVVWINPQRLRDPGERHETAHPFWHAQARVSVQVDGLSERLWLFGAHFSPFVPSIRVQEAYATANLADGRLVIGGGDFNDGLMDPVVDRGGMPAYKRLRYLRPGGESAAGVLAAAELVDVAAVLNQLHWSAVSLRRSSSMRLRFVVTGCTRAIGCVRDRRASTRALPYDPELSDHCAIHAWFDLAAVL